MSASDKKRQRKESASTYMTQRQKEEQKEARTLKMYTWGFWVVMILIVAIVAGMALYAPVDGIVRRNTTAVQVGDYSMDAVELNYFYVDEINTYCQNYSSYLSYMLDTSKSIGHQFYDEKNNITWADNFLDMTITSINDTYALYNASKAAGYKLSDEDQASLTELKDNLKTYADYYGNGNVTDYLVSIYGNGANLKTYLAYYEVVLTANAYNEAYAEDLKESYTPAQLRDFEKEKPYEYNSYSYISFLLSLDKFKRDGEKDDKGNVTYTDEQMAQFRDELKKAAEKLSATDNNTLEKLNAAIKELEISLEPKTENKDDNKSESSSTTDPTTAPTTSATTTPTTAPSTDKEDSKDEDKKEEEKKYSTATENDDLLYTKITTAIQEWLRDDARKEGDITMIANTTKETKDGKEVEVINGYYIVIFKSMNKNDYALANVRHVLISFEGGKQDSTTGQTTYTDAEKKAAKEKAEKLYDEWKKAGDLSETSFAELAKKNSKDNAEDGGLYEDVYPGQMVAAFNDWCFADDRKVGDTGIVETEYGYHIMFYSGDSDTIYRDYLITTDKQTKDMADWKDGLVKALKVEKKNDKFIDRDMMLNTGSSF